MGRDDLEQGWTLRYKNKFRATSDRDGRTHERVCFWTSRTEGRSGQVETQVLESLFSHLFYDINRLSSLNFLESCNPRQRDMKGRRTEVVNGRTAYAYRFFSDLKRGREASSLRAIFSAIEHIRLWLGSGRRNDKARSLHRPFLFVALLSQMSNFNPSRKM